MSHYESRALGLRIDGSCCPILKVEALTRVCIESTDWTCVAELGVSELPGRVAAPGRGGICRAPGDERAVHVF